MSALLWLAAALILVGAEALSGELVLLMLAGGALAASGTALFDLPLVVDGIVFAGVSVLLLGAVRPVARRHLMRRPMLATNADALQGKTATVVDTVDGHRGQVKLDGAVWSARSLHESDVFEPGQDVMVMHIDGATAVVWKG